YSGTRVSAKSRDLQRERAACTVAKFHPTNREIRRTCPILCTSRRSSDNAELRYPVKRDRERKNVFWPKFADDSDRILQHSIEVWKRRAAIRQASLASEGLHRTECLLPWRTILRRSTRRKLKELNGQQVIAFRSSTTGDDILGIQIRSGTQ